MKSLAPATGAATVLLLALAACGSNDDDRVAELEAELEAVTADTSEEEDDDNDDELASKDRDLSDDPLFGDREFTGRMTGPVEAEVGEAVEFDTGILVGVGDYIGTVTLEELTGAPGCTDHADNDVTPYHGQYIYAQFNIAVDEDSGESFSLNSAEFRWLGLDEHITDYDTFVCEEELGGLRDDARPGESITQTIVFDVPEFEGTLSYRGATYDIDWTVAQDDYENGERLPEEALGGSVSEPDEAEETEEAEASQEDSGAEMYADISSFESCEDADIQWGGLMNVELDGHEIDGAYLADLEDWMVANGCW